jgi:hypothetical protein
VGVVGVAAAVCLSLPPRAALPSASADPPPATLAPPPITPSGPPAAPAPGVAPAAQFAPAQPAGAPSQLDEPLRLVAAARQAYQSVQSYTCTLVSQERVRGRLEPENVITFTFRARPFSVNMRWLAPADAAGREVIYVHGANKNMMRVHDNKGLGKLAGFVSIAPNDPRVLEHSRHTIVEAGIGNLIERFGQSWEYERRVGKTRVQMAEYEYNQKRCVRVETMWTERNTQAYCYRSVAYFDKASRLPIRVECYDWPRQGGPPGGDMLETFSYANLQLNVPVNDALYNR